MAKKDPFLIEEGESRLHATVDSHTMKNLRTLQINTGKSSDEIVVSAIEEYFSEQIAKIAEEKGFLLNSPQISIRREDVSDRGDKKDIFDEICNKLNLSGSNGKTSSINEINLEVKKSWVTKSKE